MGKHRCLHENSKKHVGKHQHALKNAPKWLPEWLQEAPGGSLGPLLESTLFLDTFFHRFWLPSGLQVGPKFEPKSKKVRLKIAFEKTSEKYTLYGRKSTLPKSKNIAKPLEGCSKSHFSYIRNEVEKVTLRPFILERFLKPKSSQYQKQVVSKSL